MMGAVTYSQWIGYCHQMIIMIQHLLLLPMDIVPVPLFDECYHRVKVQMKRKENVHQGKQQGRRRRRQPKKSPKVYDHYYLT